MTDPSTTPAPERHPWRLQLPIYATGFFNGNVYFLTGILMPLWALIVVGEDQAFLIGLIVASRQVLPVLLAIHGGALMDRLGARRVMLVFGAIGIITMAAFPFFPFVTAIMALQALSGLAETLGWVGSQTLVGTALKGHSTYTGRLSFALRLGGFLGPWLCGVVWHHYGPKIGFFSISGWIALGWIAGWLVPVRENRRPPQAGPFHFSEILPRWSDYVATFRMISIASLALVVAVTFMRQTGSGMQLSFYPVWLNQLGVTAADIGFMVGSVRQHFSVGRRRDTLNSGSLAADPDHRRLDRDHCHHTIARRRIHYPTRCRQDLFYPVRGDLPARACAGL